jgi:hypothetical protein
MKVKKITHEDHKYFNFIKDIDFSLYLSNHAKMHESGMLEHNI